METSIRKLLKFIDSNPSTWKERLEEKPLSIRIRKHPSKDLYIFKYDMIDTDFGVDEMTLACRGCILEIKHRERQTVVCYPMKKFFNRGEKYAAKIDISTARAFEKIDGSLIKLYNYEDKWIWATNNGFDAEAELMGFLPVADEKNTKNAKTFQDLINAAIDNESVCEAEFYDGLDKEYTYWFELTSPMNRIVLPYEKTKLWFLGCRSNLTFEERDPIEAKHRFSIPFELPKLLTNEDVESPDFVKRQGIEGVVLVDKDFNRVKVKTEAYVFAHRIKGEQQFSEKHLFECIKSGSSDDVVGLFPEYGELVDKMKSDYSALLEKIKSYVTEAATKYASIEAIDEKAKKKEFAEWVMSPNRRTFSPFLFAATKNGSALSALIEKIDYPRFLELAA